MTDDQAEKWANENPKDPRSEHVLMKVYANRHPEDPRSALIHSAVSRAMSTPPEGAENSLPQSPQVPAPQGPPPPNPFNVANKQQADTDKQTQEEHLKHLINDPASQGGMAITGDDVNKMAATAILPGMASKLPMAASALGRVGIGMMTGATQGAVNSPGDALGGAAAGGIAGGVGGSILEGVSGLLGGIKGAASNVSTAMRLKQGDPTLFNEARDKIEQARTALGNPGPTLNEGGSEYLRQMTNRPVTGLTTSNFDKKALINGLGDQAGTDLADYAKQLTMAKKTASNPIKSGIGQTAKAGLSGAANSASSPAGTANDPRTLSAILSLLTNK